MAEQATLTQEQLGKVEAAFVGTGVHAKILAVTARIGKIEANGRNKEQGYSYQAWAEVLPAIRAACVDLGLCITPSMDVEYIPVTVTAKDGQNMRTVVRAVVRATFTIRDIATGEEIALKWAGEAGASDDKGIQKAMTSATKYLYLKLFMITVRDDHDPDGDQPRASRASAGTRKAQSDDPNAKAKLDAATWWAKNGGNETLLSSLRAALKTKGEVKASWEFIHYAREVGCLTASQVLDLAQDGVKPE